jgi:hypothetical protein
VRRRRAGTPSEFCGRYPTPWPPAGSSQPSARRASRESPQARAPTTESPRQRPPLRRRLRTCARRRRRPPRAASRHPTRALRSARSQGPLLPWCTRTDAVGVATNRPNQDDVSHEGASGVGLHRDVDGPHPPPGACGGPGSLDSQHAHRLFTTSLPGGSIGSAYGLCKSPPKSCGGPRRNCTTPRRGR